MASPEGSHGNQHGCMCRKAEHLGCRIELRLGMIVTSPRIASALALSYPKAILSRSVIAPSFQTDLP